MAETSTKPYLIRAIYEWCNDNGYTPYLAVAVDERTLVPREHVKAGEIVLNCMDEDGVRCGYDIAQLAAARARLTIPLVASGGAGAASHFLEVFEQARVSGALAASVFHTGTLTIPDLKTFLSNSGIEVRP